ncbi:MAG: hypothetical protein JETCAE01_25800 [Anaerolineaceae bacterium]|nr:MAG: hypothetical protein JETCAE01_25800 [Anaerolineaceae bacterium]
MVPGGLGIELEHPTIGVLPVIGMTLKMGSVPVRHPISLSLMGGHGKRISLTMPRFPGAKFTRLAENGCIE